MPFKPRKRRQCLLLHNLISCANKFPGRIGLLFACTPLFCLALRMAKWPLPLRFAQRRVLKRGVRRLSLRYSGPDTDHVKTVIPGQVQHRISYRVDAQVLFCDPVVPSCVAPELQSCPPCAGLGSRLAWHVPGAAAPAPAALVTATENVEPMIPAGSGLVTFTEISEVGRSRP